MRGLVILCSLVAPVAAEPNLVLRREPVRSLRMRPKKVAQKPEPAPRPKTPMPAAPNVSATSPEPIAGLEGLRTVTDPVSFSLQVGYQIDGARSTGRGGLDKNPPTKGVDYSDLRSYAFGEAFLSTRGIGIQSLETYFALRFQAAQVLTVPHQNFFPGAPDDTKQVPSPIATWFEESGYEFRTGWAELRDFLPPRFGLQKLRVRAGSQHIYGPWVLHLDGLNVAYEGPTVTASLFSGTRHSDYTRGSQSDRRPLAFGASLRFDLRGVTNAVPIAVEGDYMELSGSDETGEDTVQTSMLQVDWRPRRDFVVLAQMRGVDGDVASQRVEVRTRYKQVTNFVFDVTRRTADDWRWDPSLLSRPTKFDSAMMLDTEARRYLDLGPVLPQLILSARAGTLFRENIDIVGRAAIATDAIEGDDPVTTYVAPYLELGGGLEVRLRRQVALGVTVLTRRHTQRESPPESDRIIDDNDAEPVAMLPDEAVLGEESFVEVGTSLKMSLGARKFSAMLEAYGRQTQYTLAYRDAESPLPEDETHGGGRVTIDAWVGKRVKLFVQYDVSTVLDTAPDISGYKSLRMMLTGIY